MDRVVRVKVLGSGYGLGLSLGSGQGWRQILGGTVLHSGHIDIDSEWPIHG